MISALRRSQEAHASTGFDLMREADELINRATELGGLQNVSPAYHAHINSLCQAAQAHIAYAAYLKSL